MATIIAASRNKHKIVEIETITKKFGLDVISRDEAGLPPEEVEESGATFEENSYIKAKAIMDICGQPTIADDSGLEVEYLNGAPGVYSARFAGEECDDEKNNQKLLALLADVPDEERRARFVSVITLLFPDGRVFVARGECPGRIIHQGRGDGGFGYDPLFLPDGCRKTFAEMDSEEKNLISHRSKALADLERQLSLEE